MIIDGTDDKDTSAIERAGDALQRIEKVAQANNIKTVGQIKVTTNRIERYCLLICILLIGLIASQLYGLNQTFDSFQKDALNEARNNSKRNFKTTQILNKIHQQLLHINGHFPSDGKI